MSLESSPVSPKPLGATAGRGLTWLMLGAVSSKSMVIIAQVVLAWMLTANDYGLYAIVMSIAMFVQTFRDGGVRDYLTHHGANYAKLVGPCFWFSLAVNLLVAGVLGAAGEIAGPIYASREAGVNPRQLSDLIWIMAAAVPLGSFVTVLTAKLRVDLRFQAITVWTALSGLVRYGGQIGMAIAGYGVYSLIVPVVAVAVFDAIWLMCATKSIPALGRPGISFWPTLFKSSGWIVLGSMGGGIVTNGFFAVIGFFLPLPVVGIIYFASSLLLQIEMLIGQTVLGVMQPVLARLNEDRPRQAQACLRIATTVALVAAPAVIGLALLFPWLDRIVFAGKWVDACIPLAILAPGFFVRTAMVCLPNTLLLAQGFFRQWCIMWLTNCAWVLGATALGSWVAARVDQHPATIVAAFLSFALLTMCPWQTTRVIAQLGISRRTVLLQTNRALPLAVGIGVATYAAIGLLLQPALEQLMPGRLVISSLNVAASDVVGLLLAGGGFTLAYAIGVRQLYRAQLQDALTVLPQKLSRPIKRLMRLPEPTLPSGATATV